MKHLSYANVISTIALVGVIAGGSAYAASKIGSSEIKPNAVQSKHIKNGQVGLKDTRPGTFGRGVQFGLRQSLGVGNGVSGRQFPIGSGGDAVAYPPFPIRIRDFTVTLNDTLAAGTREFRIGTFSSVFAFDEGLECTIEAGGQTCRAKGPTRIFGPDEGIAFNTTSEDTETGGVASYSWRATSP